MPRIFKIGTDSINTGLSRARLVVGPLTIAVWIKPRSDGSGHNGEIIGNYGSFGGGEFLHQANNSMQFYFEGTNAGADSLHREMLNGTIIYNRWQFVRMTWTGATSVTSIKFYWEEVETGYNVSNSIPSGLRDASKNDLVIAEGGTYDGIMGFMQIFNRVITAPEGKMCRLYPGSVTNGLIGFYPIWGDGGLEPDYSTLKNPGIVTGTTKTTDAPPILGCFFPRGFSRHAYVVPAVAAGWYMNDSYPIPMALQFTQTAPAAPHIETPGRRRRLMVGVGR